MKKLCVSIVEPSVENARRELDAALERDVIAEVRLDAIDDLGPTEEGVDALLERVPVELARDVLVTWRRQRDGGRRDLDDAGRLRLLAHAARRHGVLVDVELDLAARIDELGIPRDRLVLSHHDFERTPDLSPLYDAMARQSAAVFKIATRATRVEDLAAHFDVLARAKAEGRGLVSLAMGAKGLPTRVLGPAFGSAFSFCATSRGRESAPGQATLAEMRQLFRAERIDPDWIVTGIVAGRIDYTLSPVMHNTAFAVGGLSGVYVPFEVEDLGAFVADVLRPATRRVPWHVRGVSVTIPHKTGMLAFLDEVEPRAKRAGAVNTVVVDGDRLVGHNTDVEGAIRPLERAVGPLSGLDVAVVGAGGAARAVVCGLVERGARVRIFARDERRALALAGELGVRSAPLSELVRASPDVLVNATPLGTAGASEGESVVSSEALTGIGLVYDLVYNPAETRLLREAKAAGCRVLGGLPMLAEQAALQFELWTGVRAAPELMMQAAEAELAGR